jgi:hypothetical protein
VIFSELGCIGSTDYFLLHVSGVWLKLIFQAYRKAVCNLRYINDSHEGKKIIGLYPSYQIPAIFF